MRFRGGGVGHKSTREATDFFKKDRDPLDEWVPGNEPDSDDNDSDLDGEPNTEENDELVWEDEDDDYGYVREDDSESESDSDLDGNHVDELEELEGYFGPEDDGGAIDPDMDAFGYADL